MEENVSSARVALKFGVFASVVVMIYSAIINVAGLSQNQLLTSVPTLFLVVAIVLALKDYRAQNRGHISYGEGLGLGTLVSAIVGLLSSAFSMFYMQFVDPTMITQGLDQMRERLEKRGLDDAQIDQTMEFSQKMMTPGVVFVMGVLLHILMGFIISLIVAAIVRREKPVFE